MQLYSSALVFWTFLLLALRAGVSALPIPSVYVPVGIVTRDSETVQTLAIEPREPIPPPAQPRQSRVRRAPGSRANRPLKRASKDTTSSPPTVRAEVFSPVAKRAQSGNQVRSIRRAEPLADDDDNTPSTPSSSGVSCASLFPVNPYIKEMSWTTCPGAAGARPLTMAVFGDIHHVNNGLKHEIGVAPDTDRSPALVAHYAKGSYALQTPNGRPNGGISFHAPGPDDVDLKKAKEATFGYSIFFPEDFEFALAGKLPGLYGGDSKDKAIGCGGGRKTNDCFSARLMWREEGAGELYPYLPSQNDGENKYKEANEKACQQAQEKLGKPGTCQSKWGMSVGTGTFQFKRGAWTTVSQRIRLNDIGKANGEMEVFVGTKSVILLEGLTLRTVEAGRIRGMMMQSFFGGSSTPDYASPKDQRVFFKDFSITVTELLQALLQ